MEPTDGQIRAIKNQSKYPGVNGAVPNTRKGASSQISANSHIIERYNAGIRSQRSSEHGALCSLQNAPYKSPPSEKTMIKIREMESRMGHFWLTFVGLINAPKNQFEGVGLLQALIRKLTKS